MEEVKQELPGLIKFIAFLQIVAGILCIIQLIIFLNGGEYVILPISLKIFAILIWIIFSGMAFCISYGLYKRKNWARVLIIILYGIVIVTTISQLTKDHSLGKLLGALISILIVNYFLTNKIVKQIYLKKYEK